MVAGGRLKSLGDSDTANLRSIAQSRYPNRWSSNADLVGQPRRRSTAIDSSSSCASATYFGPFFAASSAAFPAARAPARIVEWLQITIDAINQASSGLC